MEESVSVPSPTVFCAVVVPSATVTPATAPDIGGGVGAAAAVQRVVAVLADQRVVVVAAVQRVVAGAAVQRVVAASPFRMSLPAKPFTLSLLPPPEMVLSPRAARQRVGEVGADEVLDRRQRVGAVADRVLRGRRGERHRHAGDGAGIGGGVGAAAAGQRIVAVLADQRVVVVAAVQRVVVGAAVQRVVAGVAVQRVVAGMTDLSCANTLAVKPQKLRLIEINRLRGECKTRRAKNLLANVPPDRVCPWRPLRRRMVPRILPAAGITDEVSQR